MITGLGYAFSDANRRTPLAFIVRVLYRSALSRASCTFFQNPDDERLFRKLGLLDAGASSVVLNGSGVDTEEYAYLPADRASGSLIFLLIARLIKAKGIREYVAAARLVRSSYPDVRFQLAGWIDDNPDSIGIEELNQWVSEGVIEYLGRLSDVKPALRGCSCYVLPSYREGTPRTVLEAMSIGRAIITTDVPGCRETVQDRHNGFLIEPRSPIALAEAMTALMANTELVAQFGLASRLLAESKYDVKLVNETLLRHITSNATVICNQSK
jgi:glycosyltransferase involved in cell wall biosynthesis